MQIQAGGNVIWSCIVVFWLLAAAKQPQGEKAGGSTIQHSCYTTLPPFLHGSEICGVCTEQKCIAQTLQLWAISFHCTHELSWSLSIMFQRLALKVAQKELSWEDLQYCSLCVFAFCFEMPRLWAFLWYGRECTTGAGKCRSFCWNQVVRICSCVEIMSEEPWCPWGMPPGCDRLQSLLIAAPATVSNSCMLLSLFRVDEDSFHTYIGARIATIK